MPSLPTSEETSTQNHCLSRMMWKGRPVRGLYYLGDFRSLMGFPFFGTDAPIQRFPDEIGKLPRTGELQKARVNYGPSKDDV